MCISGNLVHDSLSTHKEKDEEDEDDCQKRSHRFLALATGSCRIDESQDTYFSDRQVSLGPEILRKSEITRDNEH